MNGTWSAVRAQVAGARERYLGLLSSARRCQEAVLARILARNAGSAYGLRYRFDAIGRARQYQEAVPIVRYEDLDADIKEIADRGRETLTSDPVIAFERTGLEDVPAFRRRHWGKSRRASNKSN